MWVEVKNLWWRWSHLLILMLILIWWLGYYLQWSSLKGNLGLEALQRWHYLQSSFQQPIQFKWRSAGENSWSRQPSRLELAPAGVSSVLKVSAFLSRSLLGPGYKCYKWSGCWSRPADSISFSAPAPAAGLSVSATDWNSFIPGHVKGHHRVKIFRPSNKS